MEDAPAPKRRKIGSRACDACKIRKVRCSEAPPCERCTTVGIACTFNKAQATRGPRSLRPKTMREIHVAQGKPVTRVVSMVEQASDERKADTPVTSPSPTSFTDVKATITKSAEGPRPSWRTPVAALVLRLCIYRLRLFPVWPIVAVEEVIASLQRDMEDLETYALANAIGAATMAQLKLDRSRNVEINDTVTANMMEAECRRALGYLETKGAACQPPDPNLNTLRTSFFLHIYHENQRPGGPKSLLYLREAIALAQITGLHKPSTYASLGRAEQQMRRRIFALLFVTERGVAMLHDLPVVLVSGTQLPSLDGADGDDEAHILPAFEKLVKLFWIFDQSGAFSMIHGMSLGGEGELPSSGPSLNTLERLRLSLQEIPFDTEARMNDVQKADICVTRQWMQVLLWRAGLKRARRGLRVQDVESDAIASRPLQIANEFLEITSRLPNAALEAHGPTIEFKIYEIANAVTDVIANNLNRSAGLVAQAVMDWRPNDILVRLQKMLAMCRGGNKNLLASLCARIAQIEEQPQAIALALGPPPALDDKTYEQHERESPDRGSTRRILLNSASLVDRHLLTAGQLSPSSWFSLMAAAEQEQSSSYGQPETEKAFTAGGRNTQYLGLPDSSVNVFVNPAIDFSWQPLAMLGQLGSLDDQSDYQTAHIIPQNGIEMLANLTDSWIPTSFNKARPEKPWDLSPGIELKPARLSP